MSPAPRTAQRQRVRIHPGTSSARLRGASVLAAALAASLALGGCVTTDPDWVSHGEAQRLATVVDATVISVRPVVIGGGETGIGGAAGTVIGGVAGSNVGGWREGMVVGVIGAVVGATVGSALERGASRQPGDEVIVQLRNGERRAIVQARGTDAFQPGDPVLLVYGGGRVRLQRNATPLPPPSPALAPAAPSASPPAAPVPALAPASASSPRG